MMGTAKLPKLKHCTLQRQDSPRSPDRFLDSLQTSCMGGLAVVQYLVIRIPAAPMVWRGLEKSEKQFDESANSMDATLASRNNYLRTAGLV